MTLRKDLAGGSRRLYSSFRNLIYRAFAQTSEESGRLDGFRARVPAMLSIG